MAAVTGAILLEEVLRAAVGRGASDIHLKVPSAPALRVDGRLERLEGFAPVKPAVSEEILAVMLASLPHSSKQNEFERVGDVDFAYAHPGLGRFRVNAFRQRGSVSMVIRVVPFGVPNADLGEEVKAVVQAMPGAEPGPELEKELIAFCGAHLARFKCPRSVDFEAELPRLPTGKLYKRILRDRYWGNKASRIV